MASSLRSIRSVLLSVVVLLTGHGLQLTLLPLQAQQLEWSSTTIGLTGSGYYLGFVAGCLWVPTFIRRVGHIRTFTAFVAVAAIAIMLAGMIPDFLLWLLLRFCTGCSLAALYTVVESWLNERTSNDHRGTVLALYTTLSLGAMAGGQLFVEVGTFTLEDLFPVACVLLIAATIPIALTDQVQPSAPSDITLNWRAVYQASHVGVVCTGLSGIVVGLLWSMGAVYASDMADSVQAGSRFVMFAILGGFVCQFPAGRLSDFIDRRLVIVLLSCIGASGAALMLFAPLEHQAILYLSAFLCGAGAMPMYSVCVAHANDNADGNFLQIASGMLIANAVGSISGPVLYSLAQLAPGLDGFMVTILVSFAACIVWTLMRIGTHSVDRQHYEPYQPLPKTTTEAIVMDPRMDDSQQEDSEQVPACAMPLTEVPPASSHPEQRQD